MTTTTLADRLRERRDQLKQDYDRGMLRVKQLEEDLAQLRATLSRISGAIQVLDEELARPAEEQ